MPCTPLFLFPPYRHHHRFALTAQYGKNRPSPSVCANGAMRKTAEERFHTLARGWLAYPVTSIHSHLPPKSGCRNHIPGLPFWYYLIIFATKCFMSYIVALYHIVFSTKGREATLDKEHRAELFSFIAGIIKRKGCKPIIVNGGVDHVHILLDLSSTMTLSEVVKEIKRSSTLWIKERKIFPMFSHWESEYGAFSVSKSHRDAVYSYIMNQEQHHSHLNVLDEFNRLLAKNYNP